MRHPGGRSAFAHAALLFAVAVGAGCEANSSQGEGDAGGADVGVVSGGDSGTAGDLVAAGDLGPCGGPCGGDTPYCDPASRRCVACRDDRDCGPATLCHMGACVMGCTAQHGCGDAGLCERDAGVCVECIDDGDCARLGDPKRSVCDPARGRCIACRPMPDTCPAAHYCALAMGQAECAPGCKTVFDCPAPDGGGSVACCNHGCVDTTTSKAHCGQCGADCGPDPDAACCAGACARTGSDIRNCGGCGRGCVLANASASCSAGSCKLGMCSPGFENCNADLADGCEVSTGSDVKNCGGCGRTCSVLNGMPGCVVGACVLASCNPGYKNCDGMLANGCEIHTAVDPLNCGNCGSVCGQVPRATAGCMNGGCLVIACDAGFGNCDKMDNNGCETDVTSSTVHCGACGNACPAPANVVTSCVAGVCMKGGCVPGFADCDGNPGNGCEVNLATDVKNCGVCGKLCMGMGQNAVAACANGACSLACNVGFGDCNNNPADGCELDVTKDPRNCGKCGNQCPQNMASCINAMCSMPPQCPNAQLIQANFIACPGSDFVGQIGFAGGVTCEQVCCVFGFAGCVFRGGQADFNACKPPNAQAGVCAEVFGQNWSSHCLCKR